METGPDRKPKVLVLSRSYPNSVMELLGLWVENVVLHCTGSCDIQVVSPVPYSPPIPGFPKSYSRFRGIARSEVRGGVEVFHPRFLSGPGYSLFHLEWMLYYAGVRRAIGQIRKSFPFDLIHAHFTYPDGVVAAHLGRRYGVPVVITEHVPWDVWRDRHPRVTRRAAWAARQSAFHISVSESVRRTVERSIGKSGNLVVVPNGVDGSVFQLSRDARNRIPGRILFAGAVRPVKGVDILLRALRILIDSGRDVTLTIAGEPYYEAYRREELRLKQLITELGLQDRVDFAGKRMPTELAVLMQRCSVLVLPSRAESFGMVLVEALACGTPVVATRCGGPEEIVNERVGVLVPVEDPTALANGIEHVLTHAASYDPEQLRNYALDRFGVEKVARELEKIYRSAIDGF